MKSENIDADEATAPTETETSAEAKDDLKEGEEKAKSALISNCGNIDVGLEYTLTNKRITVTILECTDLPNQDRGVPPIIQVSDRSKRHSTKSNLGTDRNVSVKTQVQNKSPACGLTPFQRMFQSAPC